MVEDIFDSELTNNQPVHQCNSPIIAIECESIDLYFLIVDKVINSVWLFYLIIKYILRIYIESQGKNIEENGRERERCMLLHCYVNHYRNDRPYKAVLFAILDQCM